MTTVARTEARAEARPRHVRASDAAGAVTPEVAARQTDGRAGAITVLTEFQPIGPLVNFHPTLMRPVLALFQRWKALTQVLDDLSFVHFAHWHVITRIAFNGPPQKPERLRRGLMLVQSNFNGTWQQYVDALMDVLTKMWGGDRLKLLWGTSIGFPGTNPQEPFRAYIRRHELYASHYWSAYPQVSATKAMAAVRVKRALEAFRKRSRALPPEEFRRAYQAFLTDVQRDL